MAHPKWTEKVQYEGTAVEAGGSEWIVPPLNFEQIEKLDENLRAIDPVKLGEMGIGATLVQTMTPIILAALNQNYPELDEGDVKRMITIPVARRFLDAAIGLRKVAPDPNAQPAPAANGRVGAGA